jgi:hypothetical protein
MFGNTKWDSFSGDVVDSRTEQRAAPGQPGLQDVRVYTVDIRKQDGQVMRVTLPGPVGSPELAVGTLVHVGINPKTGEIRFEKVKQWAEGFFAGGISYYGDDDPQQFVPTGPTDQSWASGQAGPGETWTQGIHAATAGQPGNTSTWAQGQTGPSTQSSPQNQVWSSGQSGPQETSWASGQSGVQETSWTSGESGVQDTSWTSGQSGPADQGGPVPGGPVQGGPVQGGPVQGGYASPQSFESFNPSQSAGSASQVPDSYGSSQVPGTFGAPQPGAAAPAPPPAPAAPQPTSFPQSFSDFSAGPASFPASTPSSPSGASGPAPFSSFNESRPFDTFGQDPKAERIAKLQDQRYRGQLTQEQFEAQRQQIMDEP